MTRGLAGLGLLLWITAACGGTACTAHFAAVHVSIADSAGHPIQHAEVTTRLVRTGEVLWGPSGNAAADGIYIVIDDTATPKLKPGGEPVEVTVEREGVRMTQAYRFGTDRGRCHIVKHVGPDTIVLPD